MKKKVLLIFSLALLAGTIARADISFPTVTKVYFEKDNQPYHHSVDFSVECYGYYFGPGNFEPRKPVGTYTPAKVYSFSAPVSCPDYGCEIHESFYVTNYAYLDYCNLIGKTEGKDFKIEHYATRPLDESSCKMGENSSRQRSCQLKFTIPAN